MLIHGFPDFWYGWRYQISILANQYKVIVPDLRGYNTSDKPEGIESYSMTNLVQDVIELIEHQPAKKAVVIGHDWGGSIAWNLAMRAPKYIEKLVILNAPHPIPFLKTFWEIDIRQYSKSWYVFFFQLSEVPEIALQKDSYKLLKNMLVSSTMDKNTFTEEDLENYVESWSQGSLESLINYYKANWNIKKMLLMDDNEKELILRRFPKIVVDTLLIWGEQDLALEKSLTHGTAKYIEGRFKIEYIPDSGHFPHIEKPEEVNKLILSFLNRK